MRYSKAMYLGIFTVVGSVALTGCFSSSSDDDGETSAELVPRTVSGTLTGPNQTTRIANATVYYDEEGGGDGSLPVAAAELPGSNQRNCAEPPVNTDAWTCTDSDGGFELDFEGPAGNLTLTARIADWQIDFEIGDESDAEIDLSFEPDGPGTPDIAVVTGSYDRIEHTLAKMGLADWDPEAMENAPSIQYNVDEATREAYHEHSARDPHAPHDFSLLASDPSDQWGGTESFSIYHGGGRVPDVEGVDYPDLDALFSEGENGQPRMLDYDIVYVNCGTPTPGVSGWEQTIRDFVAQGGKFHATDLESTYVVGAFPEYVESISLGGTPSEGLVVDGFVDSWLDGDSAECHINGELAECINDDGVIEIITTTVVRQLVPNEDEQGAAVTPLVTDPEGPETGRWLTLTFTPEIDGERSGSVFFNSYHTSNDTDPTGFNPTERVLEALFYADSGLSAGDI